MVKTLTLILLCNSVLFCLTFLVLSRLEKRLEQEQTRRMQKYSIYLQKNLKYLDLSLTYVKSPKLRILTWTKSYHSLIETLTSGLDLIYMAQLAVGLVLAVSLICSKFLEITL